jgi:hypothetical protein
VKPTTRIKVLLPIFCVLGCIHYSKYIPDPEKDIELWVANFSQQRSFSYRYSMHTSYVDTRAEGHCVIDRGEIVAGIWEQEGERLSFEYIGLQDREYSIKDNEWVSTSRGEQSDVLVQIERLLQFDKFEYQGINGVYTYLFKANIPFLAPGRWKEMVGVMGISKHTYLPVSIWAGLPDSSVSWTIDLYDYNKKQTIKAPPVAWHAFHIQDAHKEHSRAIKKRLQALHIDFRLHKDKEGYRLDVPEYYTLEDIEGYLMNHTITGYRVTRERDQAIMIAYVRNNKNTALYCAETLFTHADLKSIDIKIDPASRPCFYMKLKKKHDLPTEVAVAVDGVIQYVASLDSDKKINTLLVYTDMHYLELQLIKAAIQHVLPEVEVTTLTGESS